MQRGDLVICKIKTGLNWNSKVLEWNVIEGNGTILLVRNSTRGADLMYLVKLDDGKQLYFYGENVRLDKVRKRNSILSELGI